MGRHLTTDNLLKAVAIAPEEVESWRHGDVSHSGMNGANPELGNPLPPPPQDVPHLEILVCLKPPAQAVAGEVALPSPAGEEGKGDLNLPSPPEREGGEGDPETSAKWQDLDARWKAILGLEAAIDTLRISLEGLLAELEASLKRTLTVEEKLHALRADVAQWTKAKNRVHHALPKLRQSIHRCTWAIGSPERRQLDELYKNHIEPQIPFPEMDKVLEQLENLQKDRQVLSAHSLTVYHDSKSVCANVQGALRTLQSNAAANAKKKGGAAPKGKFFKHIRRWSGAE
jgi:hypothetical protein